MFAGMGRTTRNASRGASVLQQLGGSVWAYAIIAVLAALVYAQTLDFGIDKFDEDLILKANIEYLVKTATLSDVVTRDAFFRTPGKIFYRPVQNVSFFIDATIGNGKASTFYITNILLHALASILLLRLLLLFIKRPDLSVIMALFFVMNPLFVQAIAWTPGRGDLLLAVFTMLSMLTMHAYMRSGTTTALLLYAASMFLAVFSKETAAVLVMLLPASWLLFQDRDNETWRRIGTTSAIAVAAVGLLLYMRAIINTDPPTYNSFEVLNFLENLRVFPEIVAKLFVPTLLQPMAGYTVVATAIGSVALAGLIVAAWFSNVPNVRLLIVFGLAWYAAFMLPGSMYTHRFGSSAYDYLEHRGYTSVIGLILILAATIAPLVQRFPPRTVGLAVVLVTLGYGIASYSYTDHYKTPLDFYNRVIESNPASALARTNRGQILQFSGKVDAALQDYKAVAETHPDFVVNRIVMGGLYLNNKDFDNAIVNFKHALQVDSSVTQPYMFLGNAYAGQSKLDSALTYYRKALAADRKNFDAALNIGVIESRRGAWGEAHSMFAQCVVINPAGGIAWQYKGVANQNLGRMAAACADWQRGIAVGDAQCTQLVRQFCGAPAAATK